MTIQRGIKTLIAEAREKIETLSLEEAYEKWGRSDTVFIDIRDIRELEREGKIAGAFHAPRGMLEFWVDPDSPYHREIFASGKHFVLYCQSAWRSSLATATLLDMGLDKVSHIEGGYKAWKTAGYPTENL